MPVKFTGKRKRTNYGAQQPKKKDSRRASTIPYYLRPPTVSRPAGEIKTMTGDFIKTRMTNQEGETNRPWYLLEAASINKGQVAHNQEIINAPANGTASFQRVGRKIKNKSLALRIKIESGAQRDVAVRYMLIMKKDMDNKSVADQGLISDDNNPLYFRGNELDPLGIGATVPTSFNNINPIMQWRDLSNVDQFVIILDKTVILKQNWNTNSAPVPAGRWTVDQICDPNPYGAYVTDGIPVCTVYKDHYLDLKNTTTTFDEVASSGSSQQYTYCESNGIYLIAATDYVTDQNTDPAVKIMGTYRYRFID